MTRSWIRCSLFILAAFVLPAAAQVDGKWTGEMKAPAGRKGGDDRTVPITLTLTAEGGTLKGSLNLSQGRRARPLDIQNGKVEGDKVSFSTVTKTKKGEQTVRWEGTVKGGELKLERRGRGGRNTAEATLKRS